MWDLHSVLGFYSLPVLIIISFTGMFWTYDTVKDIIAAATHSKIPPKKLKPLSYQHTQATFSLQQAYETASTDYPGAIEFYITPATKKNAAMRILMRYPYTLIRKQSVIFYHAQTGEVLQSTLYNQSSGYDKFARANFDFHTGRIRALGLGSKIIYFLIALITASMPVTGVAMWLNKRNKKRQKKKIAQPA